jgi:hypothetical protein
MGEKRDNATPLSRERMSFSVRTEPAVGTTSVPLVGGSGMLDSRSTRD